MLVDARGRQCPHRRRRRVRQRAPRRRTTPTRSSGTSASRSEGWAVRDHLAARPAEVVGRHRLREAGIPSGRRHGRVRRVTYGARRARSLPHGADARDAPLAEAGVVAWDQGVPTDRRDHRHGGPLPVSLHHQGEPRRPLRRRRPSSSWWRSASGIDGCTSRSCRSSTASSASPGTRARTEHGAGTDGFAVRPGSVCPDAQWRKGVARMATKPL